MPEKAQDGVLPCVGCDKRVDALYCSPSCAEQDDGKVLESPITGKLYYVTEWEEKGDGKFVSHEKERIIWERDTEN